MKISASALYTIGGAAISIFSILFLKFYFKEDYVQLREVIIFGSTLGVLLPFGLDSAHFLLRNPRPIFALIFWLTLILFVTSIVAITNFSSIFLVFSILIALSILASALFRFKSLDYFYLFNNVVFKILQILLLIFWHLSPIFFYITIFFSSLFILYRTFKFKYLVSFSFFFIGLQGFIISQFLRLPYVVPFWNKSQYFYFDIFISISGVLWSLNLIYDRMNEGNLAVKSSNSFDYFRFFWKYQVVVLLIIFYSISVYSGLNLLSIEALILILGLSILNSLPPILKYSNKIEVLIFLFILVLNNIIFQIFLKGFSGLFLFFSSIFLYFAYFVYFIKFRNTIV